MKKKFLSLISLLSLLSFLAIFTQRANADVNYDINDMDVTAEVNRDGSLMMHREIYYDFDSDAHGVFYTQNLGKKQSLSNIKVKVDGKNIVPAKNGDNNTYQLTKDGNSYRFKVFHSINEDQKVRVEYSYRILNAITNYKDTAELNFKIIGNGWDTDINNARVTVLFPGKVKGLKAWAHGPLNGQTQVLPNQGKIIMTVDHLSGDTGIEVHSIFPPAITSANMNFVNKNRKKAVEKQEAILANEANQRRQEGNVINVGLLIIVAISSIWVIISGFFGKKIGSRPRKWKELVHNYEIPDISPVAAQILDEASEPDTKAFTAYLMQLAGKHKIKIEDYRTRIRKKTAYRITVVDDSILQDDLLNFLFNKVGDGKSFTTKDLRDYTSRKLGKKYEKWRDRQYKLVEDANFFDAKLETRKYHRRMFMISGVIVSVVALVLALYRSDDFPPILDVAVVCGMILVVLEFIAFFVGNKRMSIYTQKGALETDKVRGFKKMLDDIGNFKMKDVGDLILWEDIMPYAVAFGLSKKVLKELKVEFSDEELANTPFILYGPFYSSSSDGFARSFDNSFSSGVSVGSSSSVSGGSGGFSSGSSGGFGGGSGGGAF
ncbi:DUF2207 domain-containing protein [Lactobacillus ultunensis]|uniref:DUF2207 domain-containing protein n=1 Tax=Lactobacillus ultunensis TaxID=227945 RepID=UPI0019141409|nr:DUF2207 domain-containing protein [Lactobacillus ultunensis]QQP29267.1 DUF2207 domain-containing protein [Lactobacillus ultunensis]